MGRYKKSSAILELERMATAEAKARHPGNPYIINRTFRDDKANDLTRCVTEYIRLKGGFASRINSTGIYNQKLRKYIPGTSRRGLADIMATYKGLALHVEIKIGRDVQSEDQKKIEAEVIRSGGLYFIAKDFESFKLWVDSIN